MTERRASYDVKRHYTLTSREEQELPGKVLGVLVAARAEGKRMTAKQIARKLEYKDDRKIRIAAKLLTKKGYPIAGSVKPPYGMFLAETAEQAREYILVERGRIGELYTSIKDFERAAAKSMNLEQLPLFELRDEK